MAWFNTSNSTATTDVMSTENATKEVYWYKGHELPAPPGDYSCVFTEESEEVIMSYKVFVFVCVIFIVIGFVGNTLSLLVFSGREMRGSSSNVYLLVLALSDSFYLVSVIFTKILKPLKCLYFRETLVDIHDEYDFLCRSFQYLQDFFSDYSTCLILAFTVERTIAVYLPIRYKDLCTVNRARWSCVIIGAVIAVFIAPYHFLMIGVMEVYHVCVILTWYSDEFSTLYVVESILFRIIPVCIIAILNIFIIVKVTKIAKASKMRKSSGPGAALPCAAATKRSKKEDKNFQLTLMLIMVSSSYVLLYIPVLITFILQKLENSDIISKQGDALLMALNYTSCLYVSGFAINFFLYTLSGRVFRDQLQHLLCRGSSQEMRNGYMRTGHTVAADTPM